jgi:DNA-binding NarL/FixJ family response regulator
MPGELTPHERRVLEASLTGENDVAIAAQLGMAVQTVKNARWRAYWKLGVHGRQARWHAARILGIRS